MEAEFSALYAIEVIKSSASQITDITTLIRPNRMSISSLDFLVMPYLGEYNLTKYSFYPDIMRK